MIAKSERRTKSELVRVYRGYREQRDRDESRWVMNIIDEAKAEQANNPMTVPEMLSESERLARYGERQAKKLGIKPNAANRIVHERRKARKS